jgi:pimeloyl-ACP methyl ester carboxylesterase
MAVVNGVQIHYVIGGHGDPVVLLHGWPATWYEWRHVMPALAKNYTVIAPDLRGLGDSSKPLTGYDGKTVAEDIHQTIPSLTPIITPATASLSRIYLFATFAILTLCSHTSFQVC